MNKTTKQQQNHLANALIFMCRYSYQRQTSADMACNSALKSLWEFVPDNQKKMIIGEIETEIPHIKDNSLWLDFLKWSSKCKT